MLDDRIAHTIENLLIAHGEEFHGISGVAQLAGDGSDRRFFKFRSGSAAYLAVLPSPTHPQAHAEARAAFHIGSHLHAAGVAVPRIFGFDPESGLILFEDLGDTLLYDLIQTHGPNSLAVQAYYGQAIEALLRLQLAGRPGFDPAWCWDTPRYDRALMLSRESGYFKKALCEDYLGMTHLPPGLAAEFEALADRAAQLPADSILHRDFQSRNIMILHERVRIIDFQGARLGPLGYDLASLLIDPYARLSRESQDALLCAYLDGLARHIPLDRESFLEGYYLMVLQRNLQILGAFAFLSQVRGKEFFRQFIHPAAISLHNHFKAGHGKGMPILTGLAEEILNRLSTNGIKK